MKVLLEKSGNCVTVKNECKDATCKMVNKFEEIALTVSSCPNI